MILHIRVDGPPVPYQRAGSRKGGGRFKPAATREYMERVQFWANRTLSGCASTDWPARTQVRFKNKLEFKGPKGEFRLTVRVARERKSGDLDNFVKSVKDGLTAAGVWWDDAMVVECHSAFIRNTDDDPHTEITVEMLNADE